jgi:hypothetical protein
MGSGVDPSKSSSSSESELKTVMLNYALTYLTKGLTVIPLVYGDKKPVIKWEEYQSRRPTEEEVKKWFSKLHNIGIVCGSVSGNLVVLDIESEDLFQKFYEKLDREYPDLRDLVLGTWLVRTGKGRHIYFRVKASEDEYAKRVLNDKHENFFEVRAKDEYVVAPPSLHPSGKRYEFVNSGGINDPIAEIDVQTLGKIISILHEVAGISRCEKLYTLLGIEGVEERKEVVKEEVAKPRKLKKLSDKEVEEIIKILKPYYVSGHRQNLCLHLAGCMARLGVHPESVAKIIYQLQKEALEKGESKDPIEQRLSTISYTYQKLGIWSDDIRKELEQLYQSLGLDAQKTYVWRDIGEREVVTGCQRLQEELQSILIEKGLTSEDALAHASKDVNTIKLVIRGREWESKAWLECKNGVPTKWVTVGKQGIYIVKVKQKSDGVERTVQRISSAVITSVRRVQFYMLNSDERFYRICFKVGEDGEKCYTVAFSEIPYQIYRVGGLQKGFEYPVQELVSWLEEDEPIKAYYAPGVWVNDEHLVIVNESGYNPEWKRVVRLEIPQTVNNDYVKKALQCIKKLVEAYRNPRKVSLVLSYAAVAPLHLWFKQIFGVGFHMLIRGERMTGKTLLIDLLKLLYMLPEYDEDPRTDYQMRVLLAKTTMPALIPECVRACTDDKLLSLWKESATMITIVYSGGAYKGFYYAIRSIIAATNERIDIPTDLVDKVLVVDIDNEDGVDLTKCRGCTPLTMDSETREGVKMLGYMLMQKLGNKLKNIKKLAGLDRREILRGLVKIGYEVWSEVFKEFGLEPFPSPLTDEGLLITEEEQFAEEEKSRFAELVEEFIRWYAEEKEKELKAECAVQNTDEKREYCNFMSKLLGVLKASPDKHPVCYFERGARVCIEEDLKIFDSLGLLKVFDTSNGRMFIVMSVSTFNKFIKFLKREYRMGDREVEKVRSSLATKLTTILFRSGEKDNVVRKKVYKIALS